LGPGDAFQGERPQLGYVVRHGGPGWARGAGGVGKAFFSEEKKQKTFIRSLAPAFRLVYETPALPQQVVKVFWSFFSKKDCFLS
jgi:hypothetical protein